MDSYIHSPLLENEYLMLPLLVAIFFDILFVVYLFYFILGYFSLYFNSMWCWGYMIIILINYVHGYFFCWLFQHLSLHFSPVTGFIICFPFIYGYNPFSFAYLILYSFSDSLRFLYYSSVNSNFSYTLLLFVDESVSSLLHIDFPLFNIFVNT